MPDWSYRTVLRPVLFALPPPLARDVALRAMGTLARLPLGPGVIDVMGHMRADPSLRREVMGIEFPTPVGLGCGIDPGAVALPALARFGLGLIEVGPVTLLAASAARRVGRRGDLGAIALPIPEEGSGLAAILDLLKRAGSLGVPIAARLAVEPGVGPEAAAEDVRTMVEALAPRVAVFTLTTPDDWPEAQVLSLVETASRIVRGLPSHRVLMLAVRPDLDPAAIGRRGALAEAAGADGVLVVGSVAGPDGRPLLGRPAREASREATRIVRQGWPGLAIVSAGGVHEPEDALALLEAGADLVLIDSGLIFSGPGLPKRCNEAILYAQGGPDGEGPTALRAPESSWLWCLLLGVSLLIGGALAMAFSASRVVLAYDEAFSGLTREQLAAANPRLLPFMAHDRVTLAGTMLALGVLYTELSLFAIRRGRHWALVAVLTSAAAGFASFFLFLGFGYFDPFHAFVTAIGFQFLLLAWHGRLPPPDVLEPPDLRDDLRWRLALWGQMLHVVQAATFIAAGFVISLVGITTVFVPEDLHYMDTTREALARVSPRLLPLIAHDRASFGGMLVAAGLAFLLPALWGFRRGEGWLWWTFLAAGATGYASGIGIHFIVGYHNLWHLAPAFAGVVLFTLAQGLAYPYLCGPDPDHLARWRGHRERWRGPRPSSP